MLSSLIFALSQLLPSNLTQSCVFTLDFVNLMARKLLSIAAELSSPPSSPSCFRDLTLMASIKGYESIAVSPQELIDAYARWFRVYGLWDYLDDLLPEGQIKLESITIQVVGGADARLTAHNIQEVISYL